MFHWASCAAQLSTGNSERKHERMSDSVLISLAEEIPLDQPGLWRLPRVAGRRCGRRVAGGGRVAPRGGQTGREWTVQES